MVRKVKTKTNQEKEKQGKKRGNWIEKVDKKRKRTSFR